MCDVYQKFRIPLPVWMGTIWSVTILISLYKLFINVCSNMNLTLSIMPVSRVYINNTLLYITLL